MGILLVYFVGIEGKRRDPHQKEEHLRQHQSCLLLKVLKRNRIRIVLR